jgi:hypothetical protein
MRHQLLRFNVKGFGESFFWASPHPSLDSEEGTDYLPKAAAGLFGPNVAFTSVLLEENILFVATVSRWHRRDEFGRIGLTLAHGEVFSIDPADPLSFVHACECFLGLADFHQRYYDSLGEMLETLATLGGRSESSKLVEAAVSLPPVKIQDDEAGKLRTLAEHLRAEARISGQGLRVYRGLPVPLELDFCALIGLQVSMKVPSKAGGGSLSRLEGITFLAAPRAVPGFHYFELTLPTPPSNTFEDTPIPSVEEVRHRPPTNPIRPRVSPIDILRAKLLKVHLAAIKFWPALITKLLVRMRGLEAIVYKAGPAVAIFLVFISLLEAIYLASLLGSAAKQQQQLQSFVEQQRKEVTEAKAALPPPVRPPDPPPTRMETSRLVRELFDSSESIRKKAFLLLEENWATNNEAVGDMITFAAANKGNKEGILLVLQYLERRDVKFLHSRDGRLRELLGEVRQNGPRTSEQASRLEERLELASPYAPSSR